MTNYVLGFVFSEDEEDVGLVRKNKPEWMAGKLNGIGGKVELGESYDEAMAREGQEEIGMLLDWTPFALLQGSGFNMWCYRASLDPIDHLPLENDVEEPIVIVLRETRYADQMMPNLSWLIPMALLKNEADWPYYIKQSVQP